MNSQIKGVSLFSFILLIIFCPFKNLKASHASGAELTYECLGGNQYRLHYNFYRDCSGIAAPSMITVNYSSSCFAAGTVNLLPTVISPVQIWPVCQSAITICDGGTFRGIEEWVYTGIVNLPGPCSDWIFAFAECCRSSAITTVPLAYNDDLYVFSLLNNTGGDCNNSSVFRNRPVLSICVSQMFCFNNGSIDGDGDSISYQLITPLAAAGTPITYDFPYSNTQPVISTPPVMFNSVTGELCMVPTQTDISVFAVLVSEYRAGVLVGQVERDVQIEVQNCTNSIPNLTGFDGMFQFSKTICAGETSSFFIRSVDSDTSQTTSISWDFGIPGVSMTNTGGLRDSAIFTWTPSLADIATSPHCFTATVSDDNCPYLGTRTYSYCITVADSSDPACFINSTSEETIAKSVSVYRTNHGNNFRLEWIGQKTFSRGRVFDSSGRLVQEFSVLGKLDASLNFESLSKGIYHICLEGEALWGKSVIKD